MEKDKPLVKLSFPDITTAQVKACEGFHQLSDMEAEQMASAIVAFTEIVFDCFTSVPASSEVKMISMCSPLLNKAA